MHLEILYFTPIDRILPIPTGRKDNCVILLAQLQASADRLEGRLEHLWCEISYPFRVDKVKHHLACRQLPKGKVSKMSRPAAGCT